MVIIDKILRSLFGVIDGLFAWATGVLYTLIVQIANVDIFGNYIYEFMGRIYVYLSIFMLFKLSVSVVNYVLNPDQLTDKSKGFGKLIQNVIIVIALIIMVPTIFDWAYKLQSTILNTNVLYTIVTGKKNDSNYDPNKFAGKSDEEIVEAITGSAKEAGDQIKYEIMSSFIYNSASNNANSPNAISSSDGVCADQANYKDKFDCLMSGDTINNTNQKNYGFTKKGFTNEYKFLISTICIGFTAYLFLVFAFDVALRCVKLGALQLIAPIPIISMLDPNSGKNGMFSKWLKECTKTYTSLFIRLIGVYFAIEIIKSMTEEGKFVWRGTETQVGFGFVKIFIILGLLMFAKQLPQFIETITGVKLDGGGLSLKKKIDSIPGSKVVGTFGKKGLAGLDAMRNGRDFREGWDKIEGTGPLAKLKKWKASVTPYSSDIAQKSAQAKHDLNYKKRLYDQGKKILGKTSKYAGTDYYHDGNGNRHNVNTINENIKAKKQWIEGLYSDINGNAVMEVDRATRESYENNLKEALIEQYGGDTAKNKEYANVAVVKDRAEREMRRLNQLQRQAYDITTGQFDASKIAGAKSLDGDLILSADALEEAVEKQRKILETVGEYASKEKEFQFKNAAIDAATSTSKGFQPRSQ